MANVLATEKKIQVISALAEGNSIRSVERMTGIHRDTIMRLGVKVGEDCANFMNKTMVDLPCRNLELDEIWGFVGKKKKNVTLNDNRELVGDAWTYVAIDRDSKLVPCFKVGKLTAKTTFAFMEDLSTRLKNKPQISTDGMQAYVEAIEKAFGTDVDYGQVYKTFASDKLPSGGYSPAALVSIEKVPMLGNPDKEKICTSFVERQNLTMRMHIRRLTRLTNAFSKKMDNFKAAVALHFGYYNFVKVHKSLRTTPAMACGVSKEIWSVGDLLERTQ
jgi:IS1 family transposase